VEITLETKIYDLLKNYPFMEDKLIEINPKFKKLKNPILKRTIAKIASIKQAAIVGGMKPVELLNFIRKELNLALVKEEAEDLKKDDEDLPSWILKAPKIEIDGNKLLEEGKNPLAYLNTVSKKLQKEDVILLKTDFEPAPLIEEFKKKGFAVFCKGEKGVYFTYIRAHS